MEFKIQWKSSPNYKTGRNGYKIIGICFHQTAGKFPGCRDWMCNPESKASAHYLVTRDGQIIQMVRDQDTAYHAGIVNKSTWKLYKNHNPNNDLIGIECECYPDVGGNGNLTDIQYQALIWLAEQLINKYNISIDRDHLIGHYQIDSVNRLNCPGSAFPWEKLLIDLKGEEEEELTPIKVIMNGQNLEAYLINGKTFVEIRKPLEMAGKTVLWDSNTNTVNIK